MRRWTPGLASLPVCWVSLGGILRRVGPPGFRDDSSRSDSLPARSVDHAWPSTTGPRPPPQPESPGPHPTVATAVQRGPRRDEDSDPSHTVRREFWDGAEVVGGSPGPTAGLSHVGHGVIRRGRGPAAGG